MVSLKEEKWHPASGDPVSSQEWYQYDYAGRLGLELRPMSRTAYTYDARGNVQSVRELHSGQMVRYSYNGDMLDSLEVAKGLKVSLARFTYDNLGRMTYDGLTGQSMTYNNLDLLGKVEKDSSTLANYSYLSDGTKLSATDGSGKGLVYRGPFVYRKSSDDSSLTLESAAFSGGRMTPDGVLLYVTDYLGSVRAVVDGQTGELYKASDYSAFGSESEVETMQTSIAPLGITLRDGYTGKENQNLDFSTNYTDFGARQYNPALRRWMTPDPMSEKYCGISPYAFCNNNPVNFVDPDGEDPTLPVRIAIGAAIGGTVSGAAAIIKGQSFTEVLAATVGGAVDGGLSAIGGNLTTKLLYGLIGGSAGDWVEQGLNNFFGNQEDVDYLEVSVSGAMGFVSNGASELISEGLNSIAKEVLGSPTVREAIEADIKKNLRTTGRKATNRTIKKSVDTHVQESTQATSKLINVSVEGVGYSVEFYNDIFSDEE